MTAGSRGRTTTAGWRIGILVAVLLCPVYAQTSRPAALARSAGPRAKRAIVVFGGFGYFAESRQRWLTRLIQRSWNDAAYGASGKALEQEVESAARSDLAAGFRNWSAHDVVFDIDGLSQAFTATTGETVTDTREMFLEFDRAYIVVLSSGFEHNAVLRTPLENGALYHAYAEVGIAASLIDLRGSGDILLSASAMGIHETNGLTVRDAADDPIWAERYAQAYAAGARKALTLLRAQAARMAPGDVEKVENTYMVTGALVGQGTEAGKRATAVFDWRPPAHFSSFCAPESTCPPGSPCALVTNYLVTAMSATLSQAGYRVLPPLTWRDGIRAPGEMARYTLSLPASPLPELASSTAMDFSLNRASHKVVATLDGLTRGRAVARNGLVASDSYGVVIDAVIAKTDPETCESKVKDQKRFDTRQVGDSSIEDTHPVTEPPLDIDAQRFLYLRAINRAAARMGKR